MDLFSKEKKRALKIHLSDGIIEFVVGFIIMSWALLSMYGDYLTSITLLPMFFIKPLKTLIAYPRLGYYVVSSKSRSNLNSIIMIPISFILVLGLLVMTNKQAALFVKEYGYLLMMGFLIFCGILSFAIIRQYRFLVYTVVSLLSVGIVYQHSWSVEYALIITGGVLVIGGLVVMGIFIAKNPIQAADDTK